MIINHLQTAIRQLLANKGKSILTMLGIVIGIGSVILIMTLGEIAKNFLLGQLTQFGTNVIEVGTSSSVGPFEETDPLVFTLQDIKALEESSLLSDIQGISSAYTISSQLDYDGETYQIFNWGDTAAVFTVNNLELLAGRTFTNVDVDSAERVIVLSQGFSEDLFGSVAAAVGKVVTVNGRPFTVTGVVSDPPLGGGPFGGDYVYMPLTTMYNYILPAEDYNEITFLFVEIDPASDSTNAQDRLVYEIKRIKHLTDADSSKFFVQSREQAVGIFDTVLIGIQMFISAVAAISLFVGGIGIMNIMLVTVKERTKEIGLRKAVGAKNRSILFQFLIEAAVLTTIGGLIGISLGLGSAYLAVLVVQTIQPTWEISFVLVPSAIVLACAVSITTGFIFGLYPAMKAAKLHPIEALRYE